VSKEGRGVRRIYCWLFGHGLATKLTVSTNSDGLMWSDFQCARCGVWVRRSGW
jgi:hypothetical protein